MRDTRTDDPLSLRVPAVNGEQVSGGTVVDVPSELASGWAARGWVALADPVPTKPKRQRR